MFLLKKKKKIEKKKRKNKEKENLLLSVVLTHVSMWGILPRIFISDNRFQAPIISVEELIPYVHIFANTKCGKCLNHTCFGSTTHTLLLASSLADKIS